MINKKSSVPLYLQIQNVLMDQIRAGEYRAGMQVPSELEISGQYHVSRMTARKALDALVSKGILYRRRGKGTYVTEGTVSYGLSTNLSFSRTLQAQGYHVTTKVLLMDVVPGPEEVLAHLHLNLDSRVIMIRRLRLIENRSAAIHTSFLEHPTFTPILNYDLSSGSLHDAIREVYGVEVAYTNDTVQADLATADESALLEVNPGSPVLRVEGVAYSGNGQPTRYTRAVYRGDMFRLTVKNTTELGSSLQLTESYPPG